MINPFDLRTIFLARHAQHVVLIHFPIALFITGVAFDLLSRGKRESEFAGAAYLNLCMAALFVVPTVITGLLAWHFALEGARLKGLLLFHIIAASSATLFILGSWWIHWQARKSKTLFLPRYHIPIEILGVVVVAITAHLGGFLTGVNH